MERALAQPWTPFSDVLALLRTLITRPAATATIAVPLTRRAGRLARIFKQQMTTGGRIREHKRVAAAQEARVYPTKGKYTKVRPPQQVQVQVDAGRTVFASADKTIRKLLITRTSYMY